MNNDKKINSPAELHDDDLDQIVGGAAYININTGKIAFTNHDTVYKYKNCTGAQVRDLCASLIGKYANEAEYDAACIAALKAKGWI